MSDSGQNVLDVRSFIETDSVSLRNIRCDGSCRRRSDTESCTATHLVYAYRGAFMRHVGKDEAVGDSNRLLIFNQGQEYQISHPVEGGDECLSMNVDSNVLVELCPPNLFVKGEPATFHSQSRAIDPRSQALSAILIHGLRKANLDTLQAEILALTLVRRSLGVSPGSPIRATYGRKKLADRAKLALMGDVERKWTLSEVAAAVGVSPVYLAQVFSQVEGIPLYRYHLQLRLARALDRLPDTEDLTGLALDLGFSSHSHFTLAFRKQYGQAPSGFQRAVLQVEAA